MVGHSNVSSEHSRSIPQMFSYKLPYRKAIDNVSFLPSSQAHGHARVQDARALSTTRPRDGVADQVLLYSGALVILGTAARSHCCPRHDRMMN